MPTVALPKAVYDECIRQGEEPGDFAAQAASEKLSEEYDVEVKYGE